MFYIFREKFENSKWPPPKIFWGKLGLVDDLDTLWIENLDEIALSRSVEQNFCVLDFSRKIQKFKMAAPKNFSDNFGLVDDLHTLWVENFDEIVLSRSIKETAKFLCFVFLAKNSKIQNGRPQKLFG